MKKKITGFVILIHVFLCAFSWAWDDVSRAFIEERLVEKGLERAFVQNMLYDSRISLRPDIAIQNLFYSSPQGSEKNLMSWILIPNILKMDDFLSKIIMNSYHPWRVVMGHPRRLSRPF